MEVNKVVESMIINTQKSVFLFAYSEGYDIISFIKKYMNSEVCSRIDSDYSFWQTQSPKAIVEQVMIENDGVIHKKNNEEYNIEAVEWLGFFYRKWHYITGEYSKQIVRALSPIDGFRKWYTLHQLDEETAIEMVKSEYNTKKNRHRKYEAKRNNEYQELLKQRLEYFPFLAKRMLYRLIKDSILKEVKYTNDTNYYDFIGFDGEIGLKTKTIFDDDISMIDIYKEVDEEAKLYKLNQDYNVFFCFIFSNKYLSDYGNYGSRFKKDIGSLRNDSDLFRRKYDYIYFFINGDLYEINNANEINMYILPLSKKERLGIYREMKSYCI